MRNDFEVLMVTGDFPPMLKGVGDYCFHISRELVKQGVFVKVITTRIDSLSKYDMIDGVKVDRIVLRWRLAEIKKIIRSLKSMGQNVLVNIQYYCPDTYGRNPMINLLPIFMRVFSRKCRIVVTMHGFWEQSFLYRARTIPMLRAAHGVIYVDRNNCKLLSLYSGLTHQRIKFIPIGSNIIPVYCGNYIRQKWRREIGIAKEDIVVGFFGAIGRHKGFKHLLEAGRFIREQHDIPLVLLAIGGFHSFGENDEYQMKIKKLLETADARSWVKVVQEPDPESCSQYLHSCDLVVFPFLKGVTENSGSALAALFHELPIIVTKGPSKNKNGSFFEELGIPVVEAGSTTALKDSILSLLNSRQKKQLFGIKIAKIKERLSWEAIAMQLLRYYDSVF
jgi:glycosyltransferase involved in cell wall biosynthesis